MRFVLCEACFEACLNSRCVCVCGLCVWPLQGYTLAEEEEDPLIFQHRQLRGNQGDTLVSGPVEAGPMKKLHVSTTALQKVRGNNCHIFSFKA